MNKRIQKKVQKSLKNRIKTKKLRVEPGDTVAIQIDMERECLSDIYAIFNTIKKFFEERGCSCLMTDKHIDIDILNEKSIQELRNIIAKWEAKHDQV